VKEAIVREQRVRDLLRERLFQYLCEFFLPSRIGWLYKGLREGFVRSLPCIAVGLYTVQPLRRKWRNA
jgi:hypothetical protein